MRSSSGNTDVLVILLSNDLPEWSKIILDNGHDKDRRKILLNEYVFPELQKVFFKMHTFLGCDQISNFLRKGKKNMRKFRSKFMILLSEMLICNLEEYM